MTTQVTYRKLNDEVKTYFCDTLEVDGKLTRVTLVDEYGIRAAAGKKPEHRSFITSRIINAMVLN